MKSPVPCLAILSLTVFLPATLTAQDEISEITFDTLPAGTTVVGEIELESDTRVTGKLTTSEELDTAGGVRFPDGTLQLSAAAPSTAVRSLTAKAGLYSNTIADLSPTQAFTEICFKAGAMHFDIHVAGESTTGGNCLPGDTGWIIDRFERESGAAQDWTSARALCLMDGMRLPEPFEIQLTCDNADMFAVSDLLDDEEWATNEVSTLFTGSGGRGEIATTLPAGSCDGLFFRWVGRSSNDREKVQFRCVR